MGIDPLSMDPRLVAALARTRMRAAVVSTVVRAGPGGLTEQQMRDGLMRLKLAGASQRDIEWVMRSLGRDELLVVVGGRVKLGPSALDWLKRWAEQQAAAVAPQETPA